MLRHARGHSVRPEPGWRCAVHLPALGHTPPSVWTVVIREARRRAHEVFVRPATDVKADPASTRRAPSGLAVLAALKLPSVGSGRARERLPQPKLVLRRWRYVCATVGGGRLDLSATRNKQTQHQR